MRCGGQAEEKWGETPAAHIELNPGVPASTAEEIIAHCRTHLAACKVPRHVVFTEIPKTSTGKIQKLALGERAKGGENGKVVSTGCASSTQQQGPH